MSDPLVLEPTPNAKVTLHTNFGPLSLELFGAQCPLTVRSFLTHCYASYYNSTIFHRLVPNFILQGGDPTNTGHGGDSIYPNGLPDEFHQRIKFNRRGMLGMANGGKRNDNGSQFFLTLAPTRELDGRNTCFGRVEGETVYNLVRMAEQGVVEGTERPEVEIRVERTEVVINPYDDIKPPEKKEPQVLGTGEKKKPKKKKPLGRNIMSFAGDEEEEEAVPVAVKKKKTFDPRMVVAEAPPKPRSPTPPPKEPTPPPREPSPKPAEKKTKRETDNTPRLPTPPPAAPSTREQIRAVRAALSRRTPTPPPEEKKKGGRSLLELQKEMLPATAIVGRRKRKRKGEEEDDDAFAALERFRAKLSTVDDGPSDTLKSAPKDAPAEDGEGEELKECDLHFIPGCESCRRWEVPAEGTGEGGDDDGDGREGLWGHRLTFEKDRKGKDLAWKKKNEELVVIDPREKTKEIIEKKRGRREEGRRGGGGMRVRDVGRR